MSASSSLFPESTIDFEDDTVRIARARNAYVAVWSKAPEGEHLRRIGETAATVRALGPAGFCNIVRSAERVSFSKEVREGAAELARASSGQLGAAHVIELTGLGGATTRAFLSTNALVSRTRTPEKVFDSIDAAVPWWLERLNAGSQGVLWTQDEVMAFLRSVRGED